MGNVTVIGAQWGDEGKGKIVDWLASRADMVVRFQGGHNAGHTLVVGDQIYKLSLLPSGIVRGTPSVIGNGVVLDPWALKAEVEKIAAQGIVVTPEILMVAETCPLILPIHRDLDALREDASGAGKIGTTRRGIGPAYEDKVGRRAIRFMDLADLPSLDRKIQRLLAHHNALRRGSGMKELDANTIYNDLAGTSMAIGVDTAMNTIVEACDRIFDTATAHKRTFIVEVMGRDCGYLAMTAGIALLARCRM